MKLKEQCYHFLQSHLQELQTSLLVIALGLLLYCKEISGYFSNYDVNYWFDYFITVERLSMLLIVISGAKYFKKLTWLGYELLLFLLMQDFIDRVFFNIKEWNLNDTIVIILIGAQYLIRTHNDRLQT